MRNTKNKIIYAQTLGPIECSDKELNYEPFLDHAFETNNMLNIAITAPKGAGKSSLFRTYLKGREKRNLKRISVIDISVGKYENAGDIHSQTELSDQAIEAKILNQLIHQIDPNMIPESIFHIDRKYSVKKNLVRAGIAVAVVLCVIYLFGIANLFVYEGSNEFLIGSTPVITGGLLGIPDIFRNFWFMAAVCLILSFLIGYEVLRFFKNYTFKRLPKIKIKDSSIEPIENDDKTLFNKYFDEILYMLEESGCDAVVFEDLERLNDRSIWGKLREINYVLNKRIECKNSTEKAKKWLLKRRLHTVEKYHPVKFVYITSDGLFKSKDRVKFFDYIIPVVPVVDKSNSFDVINKIANEYMFDLDSAFLGSINIYIDDMRIIHNIFNEFSIYKAQLGNSNISKKSKLKDTHLLSIILYKNIMPSDFEAFQYKKGFVYYILQKINIIKVNAVKNGKVNASLIRYKNPRECFNILKLDFDKAYKSIIKTNPNKLFEEDNYLDLIKYLIGYGYISIDDPEYCSYFYTDNLNDAEREFILSVKHNEPINMTQELVHISDIINRLDTYLDSEHMLNCYIVYGILSGIEAKKIEIFKIIKKSENLDFVNTFIGFMRNKNSDNAILKAFVTGLNDEWNNLFVTMQKKGDYNLYKQYAELTISYCTKNRVIDMNIDNCLTNLFNNSNDIIGGEL